MLIHYTGKWVITLKRRGTKQIGYVSFTKKDFRKGWI